jgi:hypothetical protein
MLRALSGRAGEKSCAGCREIGKGERVVVKEGGAGDGVADVCTSASGDSISSGMYCVICKERRSRQSGETVDVTLGLFGEMSGGCALQVLACDGVIALTLSDQRSRKRSVVWDVGEKCGTRKLDRRDRQGT